MQNRCTSNCMIEHDDVALAQALERNDYVNEIHFDVRRRMEQQHRWDNLLRVLTTAREIGKGAIHRLLGESGQSASTDHSGARMVLQAVQQNPFVHTVGFERCDLSSSGEIISSFLDTATSLVQFKSSSLHHDHARCRKDRCIPSAQHQPPNIEPLRFGGNALDTDSTRSGNKYVSTVIESWHLLPRTACFSCDRATFGTHSIHSGFGVGTNLFIYAGELPTFLPRSDSQHHRVKGSIRLVSFQ